MFIRGFRAKRVFLWTRLKGAAGPRPDDPDNRREDEIQVTRVPDVPSVRKFSFRELQENGERRLAFSTVTRSLGC